jgi:Domain of Unknown Function with PDB structure (DUF3862)
MKNIIVFLGFIVIAGAPAIAQKNEKVEEWAVLLRNLSAQSGLLEKAIRANPAAIENSESKETLASLQRLVVRMEDVTATVRGTAEASPKEVGITKRGLKPFVPPKEINWEYATKPVERGVTAANYEYIRDGMTYSQVVEILGERGQEISSSSIGGVQTVMYQWTTRGGFGNMNAMFQNGKLITKAQFGLQ